MSLEKVEFPEEFLTREGKSGKGPGEKFRIFSYAERAIDVFHGPRAAWVVLCVGLILTISAWFFSTLIVNENAQHRFTVRSEEIAKAIEARMKVYEGLLWGGVAFFHAADQVDRDMWKKYVKRLELDKSWPGIQGLGFSTPVSPEDRSAHIQALRDEGFPDYTIRPEGIRDGYSAIVYLEPFDWRNQRALGYDMWSNDMRRAAMMRARDEGRAATSGIITLVQETKQDVQKGFLTYVPLYKHDARYKEDVPLDSVEARRAAFRGWVYAPFRMGDLMRGILGEGETSVAYEIFSGENIDENHLLFDNDKQFSGKTFGDRGQFSNTTRLDLQGQTWTINFSSGPDSVTSEEKMIPVAIGVAGIIIDFLLFYVITSLAFVNRRVHALALDITQELNAEKEKVAEEKGRAEKSNDRLRNAIEALQDGFAIYDPDDRLIIANSKYGEFYSLLADLIEPGVSFETLIREGALRGQWPEAVGREEDWVAERMERHRIGGEVFEQPLSDGRWLQVAEYITADGDKVGIRVNISDLKSAQAEANEARLEAEAASQAKSQFLSMMSHEIRTPLNGVLGIHRLLESEDLPPSVKAKLQAARESAEFLLVLVNQVLDFSRIEAGSIQSSEETFLVDVMLNILRSMFAPQVEEKGLRFEYDIVGDGRAPLSGDYDNIRQVLFNLVGNAIKFTSEGSVKIIASVDEDGPNLYRLGFTVSDTGPGIRMEDQEKIFEEFFQTPTGQEAGGGTGLGLSIAKRLASSMGGSLKVQSEVGRGATFYFSVPVRRSDSLANTVHGDIEGVAIRPLHALLVEDNEINQTVACEILKRDGHTTEIAVDGIDAIEMLSEQADRFDLVLMDIRMPRMDGVHATQAIRAMGLDARMLPIIGLTANAYREQKREYLDAGMQGVLTKPIEIAVLRRALARVAADSQVDHDRGGNVSAAVQPEEAPDLPRRDDRLVTLVDDDLFPATQEMLPRAKWLDTWCKFQTECDRMIAELENSDIGGAAVMEVAHDLKGMSANLGFTRLSAECSEIVAGAWKNADTRQLRAGLRVTFELSMARAESVVSSSTGVIQREA